MAITQGTSLRAAERTAVERFVADLAEALGDDLEEVWLYGSRARGEPPREDSDVDLMVIARGGAQHQKLATRLAVDASLDEGFPAELAVHVWDREHLERRRAIRSFFVQEVDRDRIVIYQRR